MIRLFLKFSIGSWAAAALSILTLPIVTALIRPEEFGRAAMFSLAVGLLSQLLMLGSDQAFARDYFVRQDDDDRAALVRDALAVPMLLSLAASGVIIVLADFVTSQLFGASDRIAALLLAAAIVLVPIERFAMLILRMGKQALGFSSLRFLFALTSFLVTLAYALTIDRTFHGIALAQVVGLAVGSLAAMVLGRSRWRPGKISMNGVRAALHYGLPFVPTFAAMWVVEGIDKLLLRHLANFTELGIFSAAYRFISLVALLQASFSTFWAPVSFELFERDPSEARATFSASLQLMAPVLFAGGFAVLLAKDLIVLLFARDYRDAAHVMPFLLLVPIMYALSEVTAAGINLKRRPRWHLMIAAGAAVVAAGLNWLLIPLFGALGAAIATGSAYILFFTMRTGFAQRLFPLDLRSGRLALALALFVAACTAHSFAPDTPGTYAGTAIALLLCLGLYRQEVVSMSRRAMGRAV